MNTENLGIYINNTVIKSVPHVSSFNKKPPKANELNNYNASDKTSKISFCHFIEI